MVIHSTTLRSKLLLRLADHDVPVGSDSAHFLEEALPAEGEVDLVARQVLHVLEDVGDNIIGKGLLRPCGILLEPEPVLCARDGTARRGVVEMRFHVLG